MVGVLGCMAERLKQRLLDDQKLADLVVGPDAYRDLPRIIAAVQVSTYMFEYVSVHDACVGQNPLLPTLSCGFKLAAHHLYSS